MTATYDMSVAFALTFILGGLVQARPEYTTTVSRKFAENATYDFVIAGAGIAGLTLADRLTEDPDVSVLVIEAGPFDQGQNGILVPGDYDPSTYFWPIVSQPQEALNDGIFLATSARVVGGGSTINAMIFARGDAQDYDAWETLGNDGWGWNYMLPYFIKSENFTPPGAAFANTANISWVDSVHGFEGPVQNAYPNYYFPGSANWWTAAESTGITPSIDPNSGNVSGLYPLRLSQDSQLRHRNDARINHCDRVIAARPNYHILVNTTVAKVIFKGTVAVGVEYLPSSGGSTTAVYSSKEVILAAGGLHTPQILQLSGIGSEFLLSSFGIDVVSSLPGVGQNFQDQPVITVSYNFSNNIQPNWNTIIDNATYAAEQFEIYQTEHSGPYTMTRTLGTNFATLPLRNLTSTFGEIADMARNISEPGAYLLAGTDPTVLAGYEAQREILLDELTGDTGIGGLSWGTADTGGLYMMKPFSRGQVLINSTDPLANPLVDFRAATDPTDLDVAVALARKLREIMDAPSMRILGPVELSPFGPGVETDDQIKDAIRQTMNPTNGHECCTAAMLPKELGGVVDDQLRVYGVQNLRVADISFWPTAIGGAPSATMYAAAEKVSFIKAGSGWFTGPHVC